jgi:hypothetical protein
MMAELQLIGLGLVFGIVLGFGLAWWITRDARDAEQRRRLRAIADLTAFRRARRWPITWDADQN